MRARPTLLIALSAVCGAIWGGVAGHVLVPFVAIEAALIGCFWGICVSFVPCATLMNKPLETALPFWLALPSLALLLSFPFDSLLLSFAGSTMAYVIVCFVLGIYLPDELSLPDPTRCPNCNYPREGLPTSTCPECGHKTTLDPIESRQE